MVLTTKLLSCLAVISAIVMAGCEASAEIAEPNEGSKLLALPSSATSQHDMIRSLRSDGSGITTRNEERGPTISSGAKSSISQWSAHLGPNTSGSIGKRVAQTGRRKQSAYIMSSSLHWNRRVNPSTDARLSPTKMPDSFYRVVFRALLGLDTKASPEMVTDAASNYRKSLSRIEAEQKDDSFYREFFETILDPKDFNKMATGEKLGYDEYDSIYRRSKAIKAMINKQASPGNLKDFLENYKVWKNLGGHVDRGKATAGLGGKPSLDSPRAGAPRASHLSSENANERANDGSLVEKFGRQAQDEAKAKDGLDGKNVDEGKAAADAGAGTVHAAM